MPAPHRSVFYRPDALPATQPTASFTKSEVLKTLYVQTQDVPAVQRFATLSKKTVLYGLYLSSQNQGSEVSISSWEPEKEIHRKLKGKAAHLLHARSCLIHESAAKGKVKQKLNEHYQIDMYVISVWSARFRCFYGFCFHTFRSALQTLYLYLANLIPGCM